MCSINTQIKYLLKQNKNENEIDKKKQLILFEIKIKYEERYIHTYIYI